jgi:hypothetical protein
MIGAIPNPKKTFQIDRRAEDVNTALENLNLYTKVYKLNKANPLLKLYTFEATETLSLGVYIDITFAKISDTTTDVTIEVRRKIGSFDKSYEVSNANTHISSLSELLTTSLTNDPTEKRAEYDAKQSLRQQQLAEIKRKNAEEKENHPVKYFLKQLIGAIILGLILLGIGFIVIKMMQ